MTSVSSSQLTLNLEPSVADRFSTLREYVAHRITVQAKPAKSIAADMDLSPSSLSRKLSPGEGDTARFNVDDLESYLSSTGDCAAVIEYLAAKYMSGGDEARKARAIAKMEGLAKELERTMATLRAS